MIGLMEHTAGGEARDIELDLLPQRIVAAHDDAHLAPYVLVKAGKRKAPFVADLFAFDADYLGINYCLLNGFAVVAGRDIHDEQPARNADLRRGKADAARVVHRDEHPRDKLGEFGAELARLDRFAGREQHRIGIMYDL